MSKIVAAYTRSEEKAHTISHFIGLVLGILACAFLIMKTADLNVWGRVGVWVYSICLFMSYGTSTLYHGSMDEHKKILYKKLDHISIYFLISGSYTVLILNRLMNSEGYFFLAALWAMTAVGIWFKARYVHRFKVFSTVIYVLMGYIMLLDPWLFFGVLNRHAKILLVFSGFFYTVGAGFYLWKSKKWTHFIWHIFVIIAASLHFAAVYVELL
ncbi:MAG: hemolysin III family protein [Flavobacteriales bacterium]|nr:hemolysin III family protein [Flavobacteriales bacterium]